MTKRMDAVTARNYTAGGEEKTAWTRIGSLLVKDDGKMSLKLDALPLPNDKGEVWVSFFEPKPREEKPSGGGNRPSDIDNDEVPFGPETRI
jgi:hypothetical protein